jgi:hypothetical protein
MVRALASTIALGLALTACGTHAKPVSEACIGRGEGKEILTALRAVGADGAGSVRLGDGTRLSECVSRAVEGSDLQNVGAVLTRAGSELALRAERDPAAATRLGFLVGAVERGSSSTAGFQAELENRMRSFVTDPAIRGAERTGMRRGRAAGKRAG